MRRILTVLTVAALIGATLVIGGAAPVVATPVATNDSTYGLFGRVFPDPHGCVKGLPATSPWAKGNVCAIQFVQWDEAIQGLEFLEQKFPRLLKVLSGEEMRQDAAEAGLTDEELQSAGLPTETLERDKRDLVVIKVTDNQSAMPEARRKHFVYSLSIHGIERAGLEGGIRAIEDLVTWTACEYNRNASPVCEADGPFPKRILEPSDSGPTAGAVLRNSVIYFTFSNPDGWHRGEWSEGGVYFQRYNGNGMDLNRDWPTVGYTEHQYTPSSEPETRGFAKYLKAVSDRTSDKKFAGGIDLHGMGTARSFSFTLLGAGQRDYQKNALTVETSILTFRDSEQRLTWSPLIASAENCPGIQYPNPLFGAGNHPMCSDQWGTVWDTINYQITGGMGDWFESKIGLGGLGIDNEMALSHILPNNAFDPQIEQLHIDGNKGLIYSQISAMLFPKRHTFEPQGKVGYVFDPTRISDDGEASTPPEDTRPLQPEVTGLEVTGSQGFTFTKEEEFADGGLIVQATSANARAVSVDHGVGIVTVSMILDYCGNTPLHPGDEEAAAAGECRQIAHYFNQSPIYQQAGARMDVKLAPPGEYRVRTNPARLLPTEYEVTFTRGPSYPEPEQLPYDVSSMDFFKELNRYVPADRQLEAVHVRNVLRDPEHINAYDTLVVPNDFMPGFVAEQDAPTESTADLSQEDQEFAFDATAAPVPGAAEHETGVDLPLPEGIHEFQVEEGAENDRMVVTTHWELPSDYDMYVERQLADGTWENRGCECSFVANGEQVEVSDPEPGTWRVRLFNYAAAPQPVEGTIEFFDDPVPPPAPESKFTEAEFAAYAKALRNFVINGGNLALTDAAMSALPALGTGLSQDKVIPEDKVTGGFFYAGWMDFNDGNGPTYDRHHLAKGVNKEGTAEGQATVDGEQFRNRHQTYEPVPIGYYVSVRGSANANCTVDRCDSPNWVVDKDTWENAGGTTAARTRVRPAKEPSSVGTTGVSLGELKLGTGVIRIAGSLLPDPTEENYHPYGLSSYALTYTGYQLFENLVAWKDPSAKP